MFENSLSSVNIKMENNQNKFKKINFTIKNASEMNSADSNNNNCVVKTQEIVNEESFRRRAEDNETVLRTAADRAARRAKRAQQLSSGNESSVNIPPNVNTIEKVSDNVTVSTESPSKSFPSSSGLRRTATWSPSNRQSAVLGIKNALDKFTSQESRALPEFGTSYIKKKNDVEEKEQKFSVTNKYTPSVPGISINKVGANVTTRLQSTSTISPNNLDNGRLPAAKDNGLRNRNSVSVNDSLESKPVPLNNNKPHNTLSPQNSVLTKSLSSSQNNLQNTANALAKKVSSDRSSISNTSFNRYSQNLKDDYGVQETSTTSEFGTSCIKKKSDEEKEQKFFVTNKYTPTVPGISIEKVNVNISNKFQDTLSYSTNNLESSSLQAVKDNGLRNRNSVIVNDTLEAKSLNNNFNKYSLNTNKFSHSSNENLNALSPTSQTSQSLNKSLSLSQNNIQVASNFQSKSLSTSQNNLQVTSNLPAKSLSSSQNNLQVTSNLQAKSLSQNNLQVASKNRYSQNIKEDYGIERENSGTFSSINSGLNQARTGNRSPVPTKSNNFFSGSSSKLSDQSPIPSKSFGSGDKDQSPNFNDTIMSQNASERMAFFRQAAEEEKLKEEKQREKEKREIEQKEKEQREKEQRERDQKACSVAPTSPIAVEKKEDNDDDDDTKDSEKMKFAAPCMKKREKKKVVRRTMSIGSIVLDWVQEMVKDYPVEVKNFSSSWNDGMVFCALIHRFNPTEFDFSLLKPENKRENFNTAFETGKKVKNIPILLDTEDMVRMDKPEPRSVQCYVQWIWSVYGPTSGYGPTPGEVQT
ncbi:bromodomain-containing protein DDB_G0270170 isoform X2 [Hydra vulgaris]|uniref:bromodomain-containing protein DDB_G0270170 isoform X2 n=1 Tax=Hydra vulgaris TaxID=6087 RepID=UPI0032EA56EF